MPYIAPCGLYRTELHELEEKYNAYINGSILPEEFRVYRVAFGVYEQRTRHTYMIRTRGTAGIMTPIQLQKVQSLIKTIPSAYAHISTRQELQLHNIPLEQILPTLKELDAVHISTRGTGGNTLRNITASYDSGTSEHEVFDVTSDALELAWTLIREHDSWNLPRKFKIAFSTSEADTAYAQANDIGFIATLLNGVEGYRVLAAGGLGGGARSAIELEPFIARNEVYRTAKALKRVFDEHGNRKNKHAARLRHLLQKIGHQEFMDLYTRAKAAVQSVHPDTISIGITPYGMHLQNTLTIHSANNPDYNTWLNRFVAEQKQSGLFRVLIPIFLGNLTSNQLACLAKLARYGAEDSFRFTLDQNICLRHVPAQHLPWLYEQIQGTFDLAAKAPFLGRMVSCAGARTCQLGICRSQGALEGIAKHLIETQTPMEHLEGARIHISGCPNSCGHHLLADLGFFGRAKKNQQTMYPSYIVVVRPNDLNLAERIGEVGAKDLPAFTQKVFKLYHNRTQANQNLREYLNSPAGSMQVQELCQEYKAIPDPAMNPDYYSDWGMVSGFSLEGKGEGECSASLSDLKK
jgi:sulfite reductase (ferredoxin)